MPPIRYFLGDYRWLSNFHECPVVIHGVTYPSSENAYQAAKAQDKSTRDLFIKMTPAEAKRAGQKVRKPDHWESRLRVRVMKIVLASKFANQDLARKLIETGDAVIEEGNWWHDKFWGIAYPTRAGMEDGTGHGVGENMLGILLMQQRDACAGLERSAQKFLDAEDE